MQRTIVRMNLRFGHAALTLSLAGLAIGMSLYAQIHPSALSEAEVERVRDARLVPADCVLVYAKFLDDRVQKIHDLYIGRRRPGREADTRELMEQFTSIIEELSDNLDDYGPRHADLRKALPKLLVSSDRWATELKAPPDDEAFSVTRRLALASIRDFRESATELAADQDAWFKLHPLTKDSEQRNGPIDIPR